MEYNLKEFNRIGGIKYGYDPNKERPFISVEKLYAQDPNQVYTVRGVWLNMMNISGARPEVVLDDYIVSMPLPSIDLWEKVMVNEGAIEEIKAGECKFKIHKFHSETYPEDFYGIEFVHD